MSKIIQSLDDLENWHKEKDPWGYEDNLEDEKRKSILLNHIPEKTYNRVLDIGCGQGFITQSLPGNHVFGVDISQEAIKFAKQRETPNLNFKQASIFHLQDIFTEKFDLIIITGVLYKQYIGRSSSLIYLIIDDLLQEGGNLVSVHIEEWYQSRFPYLKVNELQYPYRSYSHKLEVYVK